jgi:iron complex transport system ATP-binding protein
VSAVLDLHGVTVRIDGRTVLDRLDWRVEPDQRWVVVGPNGSGKTTLLRVVAMYLHPSAGQIEVLGQRVGRVDVRRLRPRVGLASAAMVDLIPPSVTALDAVVTARHGALAPWWHRYDEEDRKRGHALLDRFGVADRADQAFATLSTGERQRVQLARTLMTDPDLVLLDEPAAGLDPDGRADLLARLGALAADPARPALVLVTHHVDEIPAGFTHALRLREGRVDAQGPIGDVLDR